MGPATFSVTRADLDVVNLYRKVQTGARYRGSRQQYVDGQWITDDDGLEEFPKRAAPEPAGPVAEAPVPARVQPASATGPRGRRGLGITAPKAKPVAQPAPKRQRRAPVPADDDDEALTVLMEAVLENVY